MENPTPQPCLSCGALYDYGGDFLCGECAAPGKIIVTCACGRRCELPPKGRDCQSLSEMVGIQLVPGMAIHVAGCAGCGKATVRRPMSVFQIKSGVT